MLFLLFYCIVGPRCLSKWLPVFLTVLKYKKPAGSCQIVRVWSDPDSQRCFPTVESKLFCFCFYWTNQKYQLSTGKTIYKSSKGVKHSSFKKIFFNYTNKVLQTLQEIAGFEIPTHYFGSESGQIFRIRIHSTDKNRWQKRRRRLVSKGSVAFQQTPTVCSLYQPKAAPCEKPSIPWKGPARETAAVIESTLSWKLSSQLETY